MLQKLYNNIGLKDPIKRGPNRRRKGRKRKPNVLSERPRPEKKAVADTKEVTDNIEATVEQSETKSAKTPATNRKRNRETGPSTKKVRSTEPLAKRTRAAGTSTKETKPEEPVKRAEPVKKAEPEKRARAVELPEKKKNRPFEPLSKRTRSSELSVKKPKLVEPPIKEPVLKTIKEKPNIVSSPNPSRANMSVTFSKHIDDNISQETLDDEVQDDDEEKEKEEEEEEEEEEEVNSERLEYLKKTNSKINTTEDTDEEEIDDEYDEEDIITDFGFREDWDWPQDVLRLVKIQKGGDGEYEALVRW
ncbi:hypothetical protein G6F56_012118 [Rhizopus delemar]|nr:hypothetical protein G6F56_012118 [Rhizopus delemar]